MSEPTLESIGDYNALKGEKRKVVMAVIFAGLLMGIIYAVVYGMNSADDAIDVKESIKTIPYR